MRVDELCTKCGKPVRDEDSFCSKCGTKISRLFPKPELISDPDISRLRDMCMDIVNNISDENGFNGKDDEVYIYECAMNTFYGKDVFKYINQFV